MHIADCFQMEYRMVSQFLATPDFLEGVTAKLIEKRDPKWNPSMEDLSSLSRGVIEKLFFERKPSLAPLSLFNTLSYYDYPHRTLSGLPTDRDIKRVVAGNHYLNSFIIYAYRRRKKRGINNPT